MKFTFVSFFIVMVFVSQNVLAQKDPNLIKILSYNIYHGENPNQPGKSNLDDIANLIIQVQPEVIALQEIDSMTVRTDTLFGTRVNLIAELIKRTGYRGYFGKAMNYDEGGYGVGLLVKKGSGYKTQKLPTPAGGEPRAAAWVKAELKSLKEVYFASTHFSNDTSVNRLAQLKDLISYADTLSLPTFFAGDLNFDPESEEYKSIPSNWKDAGLVAGDTTATYAGETGKRIDYVWYDSDAFELVEYKVIDLPHSDHFPVLVTLRLIIKPDPI
ncbi:MAG: endonuclease/exonuclease/phosphatase family protein [Algoriphagus sp.]|nr:endonuclease/exonuclease/phosphatase family protein [Algoriphagus sp.]